MRSRSIYDSECMEPLSKPWNRKLLVFLAALVILIPRMVAAEPVPLLEMPTPHIVLKTGDGKLTGPNGLDYRIPEGSHIITNIIWQEHDDKFKLLQDRETKLTAENTSLRKSVEEFPWGWIAVSCAVGVVTGTYVGLKF